MQAKIITAPAPANNPALSHFSINSIVIKLADLARALGHCPINQQPGAWVCDLDDHWRIAVNGHSQPVTLPRDALFSGSQLSPGTCLAWYNGFLAANFDPYDGFFAYGSEANPARFMAAIDSLINLFQQPEPPDRQPWRYVGE
jgi:hypothetical protein